MKQKVFSTKVLAEIAIFAALGLVLDALSSGLFRGIWVNGGSICIAMTTVFILSYRRGLLPGLLCGFILSIVQMFSGIYVINGVTYSGAMRVLAPFFQILLDYILGYTLCGLAGAFAKKYHSTDSKKTKIIYILIGTITAGLLKLMCHVLAGGFFWLTPGSWNGINTSSWLYSFVYNGSYGIPNIILCTSIMVLLSLKYDFFLSPKEEKIEYVKTKRTLKNIIIKSVMAVIAIGAFVFATIKLSKSVYTYENDDMVHTTIKVNDEVIVDNFTSDSYELTLKEGDKVTFDLSSKADGYTCIKSLAIKDTDKVITFGYDGNFTSNSQITLPESYNSDDCDWGSDYTAFYEAVIYTADSDQTLIMTPYIGGSGVDLNYDYVIAMIVSLIVLFFAIQTIINEGSSTFIYTSVIFGIVNVIVVSYSLGVFFKALNKALSKHKEFAFNDYSKYLFSSIAIIIVYTLVVVISYIVKKKLDKKKAIENESIEIDTKEEAKVETSNTNLNNI